MLRCSSCSAYRSSISTLLARFTVVVFSVAVVASAVLGCKEKVDPPVVITEIVTIGGISPKGADIEATLEVTNPNAVELSATGVHSKITIGEKADVATATMTQPLILPARSKTKPKVPIKIEWTDSAALQALAATKQPAPYIVEGSADFANPRGVAAKTPFTIRGMMSPDELAKATGTFDAGAPPEPTTSADAGKADAAAPKLRLRSN